VVEVWRAYVEPDGDGRIHVAAGGGSGHREQRNGQSEHGEFGELGRAEEGRERHEHGEEEGRDELHRVPDEEGNRWQSSGNQVAINWQSNGNQLAIKWQSSGNLSQSEPDGRGELDRVRRELPQQPAPADASEIVGARNVEKEAGEDASEGGEDEVEPHLRRRCGGHVYAHAWGCTHTRARCEGSGRWEGER